MRFLPLVFVSFATAGPAFGWGCEGHQIVALIARTHLSSAASASVDEMLRGNPVDPDLRRFCREKPEDPMADAATWADDARTGTKTGPWHYIDIPLSVESGDAMKWCPPIGPSIGGKDRSGCVINALQTQWAILKDKSQPAAVRAEALRYVIHFTGDLHQPLHTEDNNDQGGNCTSIQFFADARAANLHSIWDTRLVELDIPHSPGSTPPGAAQVAAYARMLDSKFAAHWPEWSGATAADNAREIEAWVWEGHRIARADAYAKLTPPIPEEAPLPKTDCDAERTKIAALHIGVGEPYFTANMPTIDEQLAKAGYRLAAILNQTF